jgi:hypothetical protein
MYIRALGLLLFLTLVLLAQEPTPILPDANMTPGDTFDVTTQDICAHGYARKVRDVPAEVLGLSRRLLMPASFIGPEANP